MILGILLILVLVSLSNSDESVGDLDQNLPNVDISNGDDYIDLEDMSDEELEEICISRGFELVREFNATTGKPLVYTHQDYVDAASECLQIEADLEEILTNHPEILEDVKKESERMMQERDRLQEQLDQILEENTTGDEESLSTSPWGLRGKGTNELQDEILEQSSVDSATNSEEVIKQPEPIFDFKEITVEVMKQIKSDMTKLLNIIIPKQLRDQITPSLKTFGLVAKDMGFSAYDLLRRHMTAFLDKGQSTHDSSTSEDASGSTNKVQSEEATVTNSCV